MDSHVFYGLSRRGGFAETMEILNSLPNNEVVQSTFFEKYIIINSYPNSYLRVKKEMLERNLIGFKRNNQNEKVLYLTEKGKEVWMKVQEIEQIFTTI